MVTISFYNNKGGVAKTTTTVTSASCLAQMGMKVLLVDMDPQGNSSDAAGVFDGSEEAKTVYDLLLLPVSRYSDPRFVDLVKDITKYSATIDCEVLNANILLDSFQDQIASSVNREYRLRKVLEVVKSQYDYCLIDCPPSLSLLTVNALTASDYIVIPDRKSVV